LRLDKFLLFPFRPLKTVTKMYQQSMKVTEMMNDISWDSVFQRLLEYRFEHGSFDVPNKHDVDPLLSSWVTEQQISYQSIKNKQQQRQATSLTSERENKLRLVGFNFEKALTGTNGIKPQEVWVINQEDNNISESYNVAPVMENGLQGHSPLDVFALFPSNELPLSQQKRHEITEYPSHSLASAMELSAARRRMLVRSLLQHQQRMQQKDQQQQSPLQNKMTRTPSSVSSTIKPPQPVVETPEKRTRCSTPLPHGFTPGDYDVVCGKGKRIYNLVGNTRYRKAICDRSKEYIDATKLARSFIVSSIVSDIKKNCSVGGFVKLNDSTGNWYRIADSAARLKITYAFWDAQKDEELNGKNQLPTKNKSKNTKLSDLGSRSDKVEEAALPEDFVPGENDVIIEKGNRNYNHPGNERFRNIAKSRLVEYAAASSKVEKSYIVSCIISEVRLSRSKDYYFVKCDKTTGRWKKIEEYLVREKTSQALRDSLGGYRSSVHMKQSRRKKFLAKKVADRKKRTFIEISPQSETLSRPIKSLRRVSFTK